MAELWGKPEVNECWLPDEATCPPVVRSVRSFMENRLPHAESESRSEDQRNIKGIFSQLSIHESPKDGMKLVGGIGKPSFIEPRNFPSNDLPSETLAGPAEDAGVDQDMGSDDCMLGQSRENFYDMGR